jgi:hypothetical protein
MSELTQKLRGVVKSIQVFCFGTPMHALMLVQACCYVLLAPSNQLALSLFAVSSLEL